MFTNCMFTNLPYTRLRLESAIHVYMYMYVYTIESIARLSVYLGGVDTPYFIIEFVESVCRDICDGPDTPKK